MSVRMNLSIGENLDAWIVEKSRELGIAKNAFVIMCVANVRLEEEQHEKNKYLTYRNNIRVHQQQS